MKNYTIKIDLELDTQEFCGLDGLKFDINKKKMLYLYKFSGVQLHRE